MRFGLFMMPLHPPHRTLADGYDRDLAQLVLADQLGFDYVSCSPFRVPVARLAAAQAAIRHGTSPRGRPRRKPRS